MIPKERNAKDNLRELIESVLDQFLDEFAPGRGPTHAVLWRQHGYYRGVFFPVVVKPRERPLSPEERERFRRSYMLFSHRRQVQARQPSPELKTFELKEGSEFPTMAYFLYEEKPGRHIHRLRFESSSARASAANKLHLAVSLYATQRFSRSPEGLPPSAARWMKQLESAVDAWDNAEVLWLSHMQMSGNEADLGKDRDDPNLWRSMLRGVIDYVGDRDPSPPFSSPAWWIEARYKGHRLGAFNPLYLNAALVAMERPPADRATDLTKAEWSAVRDHLQRDVIRSPYELLQLPNTRFALRVADELPDDRRHDEVAEFLGLGRYAEIRYPEEGGDLQVWGAVQATEVHEHDARRVFEETVSSAQRSFDGVKRRLSRQSVAKPLGAAFQNLSKEFEPFYTRYHDSNRIDERFAPHDRADLVRLFASFLKQLAALVNAEPPIVSGVEAPELLQQIHFLLKFTLFKDEGVPPVLLELWWTMLKKGKNKALLVPFQSGDFRLLSMPNGLTVAELLEALAACHEEGAEEFDLKPDGDFWVVTLGFPRVRDLARWTRAVTTPDSGEGRLRRGLRPLLALLPKEGHRDDGFRLAGTTEWGDGMRGTLRWRFRNKVHHETIPPSPSLEATPLRGASNGKVYVFDSDREGCRRPWPEHWTVLGRGDDLPRNGAPHVVIVHDALGSERLRQAVDHKRDSGGLCVEVFHVTGGDFDEQAQDYEPYPMDREPSRMSPFVREVEQRFRRSS